MILVGNRRTEQGKDAIAQGLRDIALIAMHGIHHELQCGINNRPGFFGIEPFNQRRRAFEVSKQGGDGLPLTVGRLPRASSAACSARMRSARCAGV